MPIYDVQNRVQSGFHLIPLGVWGRRGKKGKKRKGKGRDCGKSSTSSLLCQIHCIMIYWLWLCEAAKMLFAQLIDSILKFWRDGIVGYMVHCVPAYLHNLQCNICDEECDILKMWIQSDTATSTCKLIGLLDAQPVANVPKFWRDCFVFFFLVLWILVYVCDL